MEYHSDTVYVHSIQMQHFKWKERKIYQSVSFQKEPVHAGVKIYQKKITSRQKSEILWAEWNTAESKQTTLTAMALKAFFFFLIPSKAGKDKQQ